MELNHDCVRQVLLDLEKNLDLPNRPKDYKKAISPSTFEMYDDKTVEYSLLQLINAHYIDGTPKYGCNTLVGCPLSSITWEGHKFLDNVRDSQVWSKTKKVLTHFESVSITLVSNIASQVITNLIEDTLHL